MYEIFLDPSRAALATSTLLARLDSTYTSLQDLQAWLLKRASTEQTYGETLLAPIGPPLFDSLSKVHMRIAEGMKILASMVDSHLGYTGGCRAFGGRKIKGDLLKLAGVVADRRKKFGTATGKRKDTAARDARQADTNWLTAFTPLSIQLEAFEEGRDLIVGRVWEGYAALIDGLNVELGWEMRRGGWGGGGMTDFCEQSGFMVNGDGAVIATADAILDNVQISTGLTGEDSISNALALQSKSNNLTDVIVDAEGYAIKPKTYDPFVNLGLTEDDEAAKSVLVNINIQPIIILDDEEKSIEAFSKLQEVLSLNSRGRVGSEPVRVRQIGSAGRAGGRYASSLPPLGETAPFDATPENSFGFASIKESEVVAVPDVVFDSLYFSTLDIAPPEMVNILPISSTLLSSIDASLFNVAPVVAIIQAPEDIADTSPFVIQHNIVPITSVDAATGESAQITSVDTTTVPVTASNVDIAPVTAVDATTAGIAPVIPVDPIIVDNASVILADTVGNAQVISADTADTASIISVDAAPEGTALIISVDAVTVDIAPVISADTEDTALINSVDSATAPVTLVDNICVDTLPISFAAATAVDNAPILDSGDINITEIGQIISVDVENVKADIAPFLTPEIAPINLSLGALAVNDGNSLQPFAPVIPNSRTIVSIEERMNAYFDSGVAVRLLLTGEIGLTTCSFDDKFSTTLILNGLQKTSQVVLNPLYLQLVSSKVSEHASIEVLTSKLPDSNFNPECISNEAERTEYLLNHEEIAKLENSKIVIIKYCSASVEDLPIMISPSLLMSSTSRMTDVDSNVQSETKSTSSETGTLPMHTQTAELYISYQLKAPINECRLSFTMTGLKALVETIKEPTLSGASVKLGQYSEASNTLEWNLDTSEFGQNLLLLGTFQIISPVHQLGQTLSDMNVYFKGTKTIVSLDPVCTFDQPLNNFESGSFTSKVALL